MSTRSAWLGAVLCLGLMLGTVLILRRVHGFQHLGKPGVKVVEAQLTNEIGELAATNSVFLPDEVLDFSSRSLPIMREELNWLPPDTTYGRRLYVSRDDSFRIQVSSILMGSDRTSIHKPEYCLPGQGFQIQKRSQQEIQIDRPYRYALPVTRLDAFKEIKQPDGSVQSASAVYVYWFLSDSRLSNDHLERMWWLAVDLVRTGELQRWAYMSCLTICRPGDEDACYERIEKFIQNVVPEVHLTPGPKLSDVPSASGRPEVHAHLEPAALSPDR